VAHHRVGLTRLLDADGVAEDDARAYVTTLIERGRGGSSIHRAASGREHALVRYSLKLTTTPGDMAPNDVEQLREAGLDDAEILDAAHVVGYYAYANRIADGLGIAIEPYRSE
jgi:alkylhydroperoxidase family enzyme